jgi:uncharacterized damage-inducible protein DinB
MTIEQILSLYRYNTWANHRLFDTAARLTPEQFLGPTHATFGSVQQVMVHTVSVQQMWIARVQGLPRTVDLRPEDYTSVDVLRQAWLGVDAHTHQFLDGLTEPEVNHVIRYVNDKGETWAYPMWQILFHQVNHATQHRSEAALVMSSLGHSTGWLDYLIYVDETQETQIPGFSEKPGI